MCFTISIHTNRNAIEKRFNVDTTALNDFGFNFFYRAFDNPEVPVICSSNQQSAVLMKWGLVPGWARDAEHAQQIKKGTYNARSDSLAKKPSFKNAFQETRCLVLATGFYEWQHIDKEKVPWYIQNKIDPVFAFAGIYDNWTDPDSGITSSGFSIVTTKANALMEKIHNTKKRMPVILEQGKEQEWLNPRTPLEDALKILTPFDESNMKAYTVGKKLNGARVDPADEKLIQHIDYHVNKKLF